MRRLVVVLTGSLLALQCGGCGSGPSDAELVARFQSHRAQIDSLVGMIQSDKMLRRVDDDWTEPRDPAAVGISSQRIADYRKIFVAIECPRGFIYNPQTGTITLVAWAVGLAVSGSSKVFVFNPTDPTPLVADLDTYRKHGKPDQRGYAHAYRHLDGLWYLEYLGD